MVNYIVTVTTREQDKFVGIYPTLPPRLKVREDIQNTGIQQSSSIPSTVRLLAIIDQAPRWPTSISIINVITVRNGREILGRIKFSRETLV